MAGPRSLYFALPRNVFDTGLEEHLCGLSRCIEGVEFIESSNQPKGRPPHLRDQMRKACGGALALPFPDGMLGFDVAEEIRFFIQKKLSCFVVLLPPDMYALQTPGDITIRLMHEEEKSRVLRNDPDLVLSRDETIRRISEEY
ncbi:MAG TPA: hypothetical protein VJB70_02930 [Candidatus Paceibacterota bacterium]